MSVHLNHDNTARIETVADTTKTESAVARTDRAFNAVDLQKKETAPQRSAIVFTPPIPEKKCLPASQNTRRPLKP